jgi:hypothetical protein
LQKEGLRIVQDHKWKQQQVHPTDLVHVGLFILQGTKPETWTLLGPPLLELATWILEQGYHFQNGTTPEYKKNIVGIIDKQNGFSTECILELIKNMPHPFIADGKHPSWL